MTNYYRILADLQDAREKINSLRSELIRGSYGGFDEDPYPEHLAAIAALDAATNKVKVLAGISYVPVDTRHVGSH